MVRMVEKIRSIADYARGISCAVSLLLAVSFAFLHGCNSKDAGKTGDSHMNQAAIFATSAADPGQVLNAIRLTESLRAFGGSVAEAPVWVVALENVRITEIQRSDLERLGITLLRADPPDSLAWLFYADKPYAAAVAEKAAEGQADVLVWLDNDAVFLQEPLELNLPDSICLAWRPVMHNRSGTLYDAPPNSFWARIYEKLSLTDEMLFPMFTPADQQKIRAYFNCGLIAVRPERGILRRWAQDFETLGHDSTLAAMCRADQVMRIFLHQTALTGSILHLVRQSEMIPITDAYNFPLLFQKVYGGLNEYNDLNGIVMIRIDFDPTLVSPDWPQLLKGPADRIDWLKKHI